MNPFLFDGCGTPARDCKFYFDKDGIARFTDLSVRQANQNYQLLFSIGDNLFQQLSNTFIVEPGPAKDICDITLLGQCSSLADCRVAGEIVCIDDYGNTQSTCETCFGPRCGSSIFTAPPEIVSCPAGICVEVVEGPPTGVLSSKLLNGGRSCN
jgi:hypothetical protein